MRIALAGFQHETNTFAPQRADREAFRMADSWPGLLRGAAAIEETRGMNLPLAGAAAAAAGADLVPLLWCAAEPSGPVTDDAFDWIAGMIESGLRAAGPVDALYLDLHGAMVTESHEDGEGELLRRLRAAFGEDLPIGVSLDLHANLSAALARSADVIAIYRTYPHLDMAETGARCMTRLIEAAKGARPATAFRQAPFLIPLHAQHTGAAPARDLYALAEALGEGVEGELALGFTAADIHDCGPALITQAASAADAEAAADRLLAALMTARGAFDARLLDAADAVRAALAEPAGPVVIADVQDNPGAGGASDTTGLLRELIAQGAEGAVLGVIVDPVMAAAAHEAGEGAVIEGALGAASRGPGPGPVQGRFRVERLSDGRIPYTGEMYGGGVAAMGPSCLLSLEGAGIRVVVGCVRVQCLDQALFRHFGVALEAARIICVKSTAHFRADFEGLATRVINAAAPGAFPCRLDLGAYERLRPGVGLCGAE